MRKVLLVVALVAASFAGGAAVNGPGLQWLKGLVRDRMGGGEAIPTLDLEVDDGSDDATTTDAKPTASPEPKSDPATTGPAIPQDVAPRPTPAPGPPPRAARRPEPKIAEPPPLVEPESQPPAEPSRLPALPESPSPEPQPAATGMAEPPSLRDKASAAKTGWEDAPGDTPSTAVVPRSNPAKPGARPRSDGAVAAVVAAAPAQAQPPEPEPSEPPPLTTSAPDLGPSPEPSAMPVPPLGASNGEWAALRKRMAALGVREYEVKGTPSGSVRFRCVVPGVGPEPAKPFEAEGDDEFRAADSALRRVAVWKAARRAKG